MERLLRLGYVTFSPELEEALRLHAASGTHSVHALEVAVARLLLPQGPPAAPGQLELAEAYLAGRVGSAELKSAQQDCWSYVGSLACGCSLAESAAGAALLACLNGDAGAHTLAALREQIERALRAGVEDRAILAALAAAQ